MNHITFAMVLIHAGSWLPEQTPHPVPPPWERGVLATLSTSLCPPAWATAWDLYTPMAAEQ